MRVTPDQSSPESGEGDTPSDEEETEQEIPISDEVAGKEPPEAKFISPDQVERDYIEEVLRSAEGNKTKAAKIMGISRQALYKKIKKLGISM